MLALNEARRNLEACLTEEAMKEYFAILRQWFTLSSPITKEEFDKAVRKLLVSEDQIRCHNNFFRAILAKSTSCFRPKATRVTNDKGAFESADYSDFVQPSSPTMIPPFEYKMRSAAAELFIPDSGFISSRIAVTSWENGMEGADDNVTELMVHACQVVNALKNIKIALKR